MRHQVRFWSQGIAGVVLLLVLSTVHAESAQTLLPIPERPMAPEFVLVDADGKQHRLSDYRGNVVAINFWATWCPPCLREMPSMQRLWDRWKNKNFVILAIDVGEDDETVFRFTIELDTPLEFPLLLDREGKVVAQWPVLGLPTTFILDKQGRVVYRAVGGREWDQAEFYGPIESLLLE